MFETFLTMKTFGLLHNVSMCTSGGRLKETRDLVYVAKIIVKYRKSIIVASPEPPMARNAHFMAFLGHFCPPWRPPGAISVGPNGPNRPPWMYPTQIQPRSTEIQPFGATGATYGHKCAFYGIFGPFLTPLEAPGDNFDGSKWPQQTILDISHPDPTNIH